MPGWCARRSRSARHLQVRSRTQTGADRRRLRQCPGAAKALSMRLAKTVPYPCRQAPRRAVVFLWFLLSSEPSAGNQRLKESGQKRIFLTTFCLLWTSQWLLCVLWSKWSLRPSARRAYKRATARWTRCRWRCLLACPLAAAFSSASRQSEYFFNHKRAGGGGVRVG